MTTNTSYNTFISTFDTSFDSFNINAAIGKPPKKQKKSIEKDLYTREHVQKLMKLAYMAGYEGSIDLIEEEIAEILTSLPPDKYEVEFPKNLEKVVKEILEGKRLGDIYHPQDNSKMLSLKYDNGKTHYWAPDMYLSKAEKTYSFDDKELLKYNMKIYYKLIYGEDIKWQD